MIRRRSKYGNRKTVVDGITFDSQREARHYQELCLREKAGEIIDLQVQRPYVLSVNGANICTYIADFFFLERECPQTTKHEVWTQVVADSKGVRTAVYRLKAKLMKAIHGIDIREL